MIEWINLGCGVLAFILTYIIFESLTRPDSLDNIRKRYEEKPETRFEPMIEVFGNKAPGTPVLGLIDALIYALTGLAVMLMITGLFLATLPP